MATPNPNIPLWIYHDPKDRAKLEADQKNLWADFAGDLLRGQGFINYADRLGTNIEAALAGDPQAAMDIGLDFGPGALIGRIRGIKKFKPLWHGTSTEQRRRIEQEGFQKGGHAELGLPESTSLSEDPLMSYRRFTGDNLDNLLRVDPKVDPSEVRNLRPSEYAARDWMADALKEDRFIKLPNMELREAEVTFNRGAADGAPLAQPRPITPEERALVERMDELYYSVNREIDPRAWRDPELAIKKQLRNLLNETRTRKIAKGQFERDFPAQAYNIMDKLEALQKHASDPETAAIARALANEPAHLEAIRETLSYPPGLYGAKRLELKDTVHDALYGKYYAARENWLKNLEDFLSVPKGSKPTKFVDFNKIDQAKQARGLHTKYKQQIGDIVNRPAAEDPIWDPVSGNYVNPTKDIKAYSTK